MEKNPDITDGNALGSTTGVPSRHITDVVILVAGWIDRHALLKAGNDT
jgi:hypothetical protein